MLSIYLRNLFILLGQMLSEFLVHIKLFEGISLKNKNILKKLLGWKYERIQSTIWNFKTPKIFFLDVSPIFFFFCGNTFCFYLLQNYAYGLKSKLLAIFNTPVQILYSRTQKINFNFGLDERHKIKIFLGEVNISELLNWLLMISL